MFYCFLYFCTDRKIQKIKGFGNVCQNKKCIPSMPNPKSLREWRPSFLSDYYWVTTSVLVEWYERATRRTWRYCHGCSYAAGLWACSSFQSNGRDYSEKMIHHGTLSNSRGTFCLINYHLTYFVIFVLCGRTHTARKQAITLWICSWLSY